MTDLEKTVWAAAFGAKYVIAGFRPAVNEACAAVHALRAEDEYYVISHADALAMLREFKIP